MFYITDSLFYNSIGTSKDILSFGTRLSDNLTSARLQVITQRLVFVYHLIQKTVSRVKFSLLTSNVTLIKFYLLKLMFKIEHFISDFMPCSIENGLWKAYIGCYLESERRARMAYTLISMRPPALTMPPCTWNWWTARPRH